MTSDVPFDITVVVGELTLFKSGEVLIEKGAPLEFSFDNLKMEVIFVEDDGGARYNGKAEGNVLRLTLFNHTSVTGEGEFSPLKVATVKSIPLYFTYYTSVVSDKSRAFVYSFYTGKTKAP